ncbi:hypothetical protein BFC22_06865 [Carnobacterium divergens]|uniref:DUF6414 family protein n=1 Tax=Carnobacterium divergens TaxID=2748 RepID=UPI000E764880|nr:hypothetical protein [Carnobacterium divergens]ANZ99835.1 hypothetical protein BFC22_06865 [Carnobacterium divergens]
MKEYIYLDTVLVNSYLAQIDEGILTKMSIGQLSSEGHSKDGGQQITKAVSGGLNLPVLKGNSKHSKTEIDKMTTVYSTTNSELVETILDDYSLDVLIDKLKELNQLKEGNDECLDGDLFITSNQFQIFDFELLKKTTNREQIFKLVEENLDVLDLHAELKRLTKDKSSRAKHQVRIEEIKMELFENDPYHNYNHIHRFASYADTLFPESILIKVGSYLCISPRNNLRINSSTLSFLSQTERKVKILGIISSKRKKSLTPSGEEQLDSQVIASTAPAVLADIILENFEIMGLNDYFVRPIAIYFES